MVERFMMKISRHFASKTPQFGAYPIDSQENGDNSLYYYWFQFLRRHEGYRKTCEAGGVGEFSGLYEDFGDVHAVTFQKWWSMDERGAKLFGEPEHDHRV